MNAVTESAIVTFNFNPLETLDPGWYEKLKFGDLVAALVSTDSGNPRLANYLLREFHLEKSFWFDFSSPAAGLALLRNDALRTLIFHTGLTLDAQKIQRTVLRDDVMAIKAGIGESGYQFAIERAPYIGPIPQNLVPQEPLFDSLADHVAGCGVRCLGAALGWMNPALTRRLILKLPPSWKDEFDSATLPVSAESTAAANLLERVATELELAAVE